MGELLPVANMLSKGLMSPLQFNINDMKNIQNLNSDNYYKICSINSSEVLSIKFLVVRGNSIVYYSLFAYVGGTGLITAAAKTGDDAGINLEFYYAKSADNYNIIYRRNSNHAGVFKVELANKTVELYNEELPDKPNNAVLIPIK